MNFMMIQTVSGSKLAMCATAHHSWINLALPQPVLQQVTVTCGSTTGSLATAGTMLVLFTTSASSQLCNTTLPPHREKILQRPKQRPAL
jgi:hypothetical protein